MNSVDQAEVKGKRIVVRCDFDVPVENGKITDLKRLQTTEKTLRYLREQGANLSLIGHLGRPEDKDPNFSLRIVEQPLAKLLNEEVRFSEELISKNDPISLYENLRFWPEEEANNQEFAEKLASLGTMYVNECFSACHRAHASVALIPKIIPGYAGLDLMREVAELEKILKNPERPLVAIIGGAKLETKLPAITNLAKIADKVLVGGKLMFEVNGVDLPSNVLVAQDDIDKKDVGPHTLKDFKKEIDEAKTVVWNGPMGMFEEEQYAVGTNKLAEIVANSNAYTLVGGGDTLSALDQIGLLKRIGFVSMGGGAMLEFLGGLKLPGLDALGYYG